ncbi:MAG: alpha,6-mannosyltransferase [Solirubrobacteraceae bacterium]|nr:alpha,6-mannosyltransferase [Solirubrobacteraceae bacterium]
MSTLTLRAAPAIRRPALAVARLLGAVALTGSVATSFLLAAAAAQRPSVLSPPSRVAFPGWMAGPLAGLEPGLTGDPIRLKVLFTGALAVLAVCWLGAWAFGRHLPAAATIAALVGTTVAFVLGPPQQLTDVFNYIQYGRMPALHGLNPYVVAPLTDHADPVFAWTNWSHLPSPYGPLFTLLGEALAPLGVAGAYWALKLLTGAASLGLVALVWTAVRRAGRDPRPAAAFAGLNPLVLAFGLGGVHNDPFVILAVVAAIVLAAGSGESPAPPRRAFAAGVAAVAGPALKASAVVFAPLVVLGARGRRQWTLAGAAVAALAVVLAVDAAFGGYLPAIGLQSRLVSPISIPNVAGFLLGDGGATAGVRLGAEAALAVAVLAACFAVWRGAAVATAAGWTGVAVVLTLTWTMPWYVLWVLPFAALSRSRALRVVAVVLTAWLALSWIPQMPDLIHHFGWKPTRTTTGQAEHAYIEGLLH